MRQYRIKRLIGQVPVLVGTQATIDVPRGYDLESIYFRLAGSIINTVAWTAARAEAPAQLVQRIELVADGKNTIASVPFTMQNRGNISRRGQLGSLTPPGVTVATHPIMASCVLDQAAIDGIRPKDSNLRTDGMSLLQLRFTFGQVADVYTGAGTGTLSAVLLDVFTSELVEVPDEAGQRTNPLYLVKRSYQDIAFQASNQNMDVILPVGNVMRGVLFRFAGNVTAGEPSDTMCNNITLRSNTDVRLNLPYLDMREANKMDADVTTLPPGYVFADLMGFGQQAGVHAADGWDLTQASDARATLNVVGAANTVVSVLTTELIR